MHIQTLKNMTLNDHEIHLLISSIKSILSKNVNKKIIEEELDNEPSKKELKKLKRKLETTLNSYKNM